MLQCLKILVLNYKIKTINKFILFLLIFQFHISYGQEFLNPVYYYFLDEEKGIPRKDLNDYQLLRAYSKQNFMMRFQWLEKIDSLNSGATLNKPTYLKSYAYPSKDYFFHYKTPKKLQEEADYFIDISYAYWHLVELNIDPSTIKRGNVLQKLFRNFVILSSMTFDKQLTYRDADKLCTSFCPSSGEFTNSYVLEQMQELRMRIEYLQQAFLPVHKYFEPFSDQQLNHIYNTTFVLTKFDRDRELGKFDEYEFDEPGHFDIWNSLKYFKYSLGLALILLFYIAFRFIKKKF